MTTYLILYRQNMTTAERMAASTPEQAAEALQGMRAWAQRAGDAVVDFGAPLQVVDAGGDAGTPVGGYSILQADGIDALRSALEEHPHIAWGGTIEILEALPVSDM